MFDEILVNNGPLLSPERLADLPSSPEWDCDEEVEAARQGIAEMLEKHGELLHGNPTEPQTKFFAVNQVLHSLGYVYSIDETVTIQHEARARVDYTLFPNADRFVEVEAMRGGPAFFRTAVGLAQATVWGEPLDVNEDPEVAAQQPVVIIDLLLRSSGVNFGIITNGKKWRLIHRGSSDTFNTYVEADIEDLMAGPPEHLKAFWILFSGRAMATTDDGLCFLDRLLA